jgi:predicted transposase/invertase (TIGR01784 family)
MAKKISPYVDMAFKKIFGVEENQDLLISLLNAILRQEDAVEEITLLSPYLPQNFAKDKLSILDIKARSGRGELFNIEIQLIDDGDYSKRAL